MKLILASQSPRRQQLLAGANLTFEVVPSRVEETLTEGERPEATARRLAEAKAEEVAARHPGAVVIGADTIVVVDGTILGQPRDPADAQRMLRALSGREHEVITAYTVSDGPGGRRATEAVTTRVRFRELTDAEIERYVATGEPLDKSGSYAVQGGAADFVESVDGEITNVIGLPIPALLATLSRFGIEP